MNPLSPLSLFIRRIFFPVPPFELLLPSFLPSPSSPSFLPLPSSSIATYNEVSESVTGLLIKWLTFCTHSLHKRTSVVVPFAKQMRVIG